jgi:hypothetical protein
VAHRPGDHVDATLGDAQEVDRALEPQVLDERDRRLAEHGADPALQRALARADRARRAGQGERLGQWPRIPSSKRLTSSSSWATCSGATNGACDGRSSISR